MLEANLGDIVGAEYIESLIEREIYYRMYDEFKTTCRLELFNGTVVEAQSGLQSCYEARMISARKAAIEKLWDLEEENIRAHSTVG